MQTKNTRQQTYESLLKEKKVELNGVLRKLGEPQNPVDEVKLNRQMENLLTDIEGLEEKLSNLRSNKSDRSIIERRFEKSLQKIDFSEARKIAKLINKNFDGDGGAILLLLQKSKKQLGRYCLEEFIELMMSDQIIDGQVEGDYRRYPIDLGSPNYSPNEAGFIKGVSEHFGLSSIDSDLEDSSKKVIETICSSMSVRTTIFLEIKNINKIVKSERAFFLNWFLNNFWNSLVKQINSGAKQSKNRVITALIANSTFDIDSSLLNGSCQLSTLDYYKIIEIPLSDWTSQEIYDWLIRFKTLIGYKARETIELEDLACEIFEESDGTPEIVCNRLREKFYDSIRTS